MREVVCSQGPFATEGRKRKTSVPCYDNYTLCIHGELDMLPTVLVQAVCRMRPREIRRALVRLECMEAK